jgi:hypothetical protein
MLDAGCRVQAAGYVYETYEVFFFFAAQERMGHKKRIMNIQYRISTNEGMQNNT